MITGADRLERNEKNRKQKGMLVSLALHALFLLIMLGFTLEAPFPPPLEQGIAIQFGGDHDSNGKTDQNGRDREESAHSRSQPSSPEQSERHQTTTNVVTQNLEEAPSLRDGLAEQNKQKNVPNAIDKRGLYRGSRAPEKARQNSSSGRRGSHEGKPQGGQEGDPRNNGLMDFPDFSLLGRRLLSFDKPEDQSQLRGVVVLNISVNLQGQVLQAELNTKKSTISRPDIVERCKVSARKFRFSKADNHRAPPLQQGSITFRFELD